MWLLDKYRIIRQCLKHPGRGSSSTYQKYPPGYNFNGKRVLNIGCGLTTYPFPNVTNVDLFPNPGVDLVWDLSKTPLPFPDDTFDLIIANHILEHIPGWWETFKDCARMLKVGGRFEVWLPGDGGSSQLGYRDHINVINECSIYGIRGTYRNQANAWELAEREKLGHVSRLDFMAPTRWCMMHFWWIHIWPQSVMIWMARHLRNTVQEFGWFFTKLPPQN